MKYARIKRMSDGMWLGRGTDVREEWVKSRSGARLFNKMNESFKCWTMRLARENPEETYEIKESEI